MMILTWRNHRLPSPPRSIRLSVCLSVCRYRTFYTAYWLTNYCLSLCTTEKQQMETT